MKICVVAPMGTSPPVVTEFVDYLARFQPVHDVVIIDTAEPMVRASSELARIAFLRAFPTLRTHIVTLEFSDINTTETNIEFMKTAARIIKDERIVYGCDQIILNTAGGRKNMCITLTLLGQLFGVDGAFHVVHKDVKVFNERLELLREDIKRLCDASDDAEKLRMYEKKAKEFDSILFPHPENYEVVQLPLLPFPKEWLSKVVTLLKTDFTIRKNIDLPSYYVDSLSRAGLLTIGGTNVVPTKLGRLVGTLF